MPRPPAPPPPGRPSKDSEKNKPAPPPPPAPIKKDGVEITRVAPPPPPGPDTTQEEVLGTQQPIERRRHPSQVEDAEEIKKWSDFLKLFQNKIPTLKQLSLIASVGVATSLLSSSTPEKEHETRALVPFEEMLSSGILSNPQIEKFDVVSLCEFNKDWLENPIVKQNLSVVWQYMKVNENIWPTDMNDTFWEIIKLNKSIADEAGMITGAVINAVSPKTPADVKKEINKWFEKHSGQAVQEKQKKGTCGYLFELGVGLMTKDTKKTENKKRIGSLLSKFVLSTVNVLNQNPNPVVAKALFDSLGLALATDKKAEVMKELQALVKK